MSSECIHYIHDETHFFSVCVCVFVCVYVYLNMERDDWNTLKQLWLAVLYVNLM